jgi:hypothetical protein
MEIVRGGGIWGRPVILEDEIVIVLRTNFESSGIGFQEVVESVSSEIGSLIGRSGNAKHIIWTNGVFEEREFRCCKGG